MLSVIDNKSLSLISGGTVIDPDDDPAAPPSFDDHLGACGPLADGYVPCDGSVIVVTGSYDVVLQGHDGSEIRTTGKDEDGDGFNDMWLVNPDGDYVGDIRPTHGSISDGSNAGGGEIGPRGAGGSFSANDGTSFHYEFIPENR